MIHVSVDINLFNIFQTIEQAIAQSTNTSIARSHLKTCDTESFAQANNLMNS